MPHVTHPAKNEKELEDSIKDDSFSKRKRREDLYLFLTSRIRTQDGKGGGDSKRSIPITKGNRANM